MSATSCPRCERQKQDWAEVCWRCHVADLEDAAYERGYEDGLQEGRRQAVTLDKPRLRQLIQLCHPDRHGGSEAANDATRWLLDQRKALKGARS